MQPIARPSHTRTSRLRLSVDGDVLPAEIAMPEKAAGAVLFVRESDTDRSNNRDLTLANVLNHYGLATVLIDLLTPDEHKLGCLARGPHSDIELQSERLVKSIEWLSSKDQLAQLPIGIVTTGVAISICAAARPSQISAIVCRGAGPELAGEALSRVAAPTLFILGSADQPVGLVNRQSARQMRCQHRVEVVAGGHDLFGEHGELDEVARLTRGWFLTHLGMSIH